MSCEHKGKEKIMRLDLMNLNQFLYNFDKTNNLG